MSTIINRKRSLLINPHLLIVSIISIFFIIVYARWPWQYWQFDSIPWNWLAWVNNFESLALFEAQHRIIGSLFLIPIVYSTFVFKWRGTLLFSMVAVITILQIITDLWGNTDLLITNISFLLLPSVLVLVITIELELRRKNKEFFWAREKERQIYTINVLEAQEKERKRLSQELHDEPIQTLVAIAKSVESMALEDESKKYNNFIWVRDTTLSVVEELRRITLDLRPSVLDEMGIISALRWLVSNSSDDKLQIQLLIEGDKWHLPSQIEVTLFRLVQEALNNIIKHAKATKAEVFLKIGSQNIQLRIQDNGQGFIIPNKFIEFTSEGKLGIFGMYERIKVLGGSFDVSSVLGEGTNVLITLTYSGSEMA